MTRRWMLLLISTCSLACGGEESDHEATAQLPAYLKGTTDCEGKTCQEGEVCVSSWLGWCGDSMRQEDCREGCRFFERHGCYSGGSSCVKVPPSCYDPCPDSNASDCRVSACSRSFCGNGRYISCAPY